MNTVLRTKRPYMFVAALIGMLAFSNPTAHASSLSQNLMMAGVWEGPDGSLAHQAPQQSRGNVSTADGQQSVFWSEAGNLVAHDNNQASDIFTFQAQPVQTLINRDLFGGNAGNRHTRNVTLSNDGRYMGFVTAATNTSAGPQCIPGYGCAYAGVIDRQNNRITVASKAAGGQLMPVTNGPRPIQTMYPAIISGDGNWFVFVSPSTATRTPDIYIRGLKTQTLQLVNADSQGNRSQRGAYDPSVSNDGRYVSFTTPSALVPQDTNNTNDVYVRDVQQGTTALVSHASNSAGAANADSDSSNISGNGRYVVFRSSATDLLAGGNEGVGSIFLYDLQTAAIKRVTQPKGGGQPNGSSHHPSINGDGSLITYTSAASNLVRADQNNKTDIFLYYNNAGITRAISPPQRDGIESHVIGQPVISQDGKTITYQLYTRSATNPAANAYYLYRNHDPVAHIPFYDTGDMFDLWP